jgi:hypothetical protein
LLLLQYGILVPVALGGSQQALTTAALLVALRVGYVVRVCVCVSMQGLNARICAFLAYPGASSLAALLSHSAYGALCLGPCAWARTAAVEPLWTHMCLHALVLLRTQAHFVVLV